MQSNLSPRLSQLVCQPAYLGLEQRSISSQVLIHHSLPSRTSTVRVLLINNPIYIYISISS